MHLSHLGGWFGEAAELTYSSEAALRVCVCLAMPKTDTVPPYRKGKLPFPIRLQPDKDATNP
jgi:hypothetical protein